MTASFLSIHHELREAIYVHILTTPDEPQCIMPNQDTSLPDPFELPQQKSAALLLCCRQINAEVKATITHLITSEKLFFELDVIIYREHNLYPTWLLIPTYNKEMHIPRVQVTFRSAGRAMQRYSRWLPGAGGPPRMIWDILHLLNRFLRSGPDLFAASSTSNITLGDLLLEVDNPGTPENGEGLGFIHPKRVFQHMSGYLNMLLMNTNSVALQNSRFIASRIKTLHLKYGKESSSWNLSELEHLQVQDTIE